MGSELISPSDPPSVMSWVVCRNVVDCEFLRRAAEIPLASVPFTGAFHAHVRRWNCVVLAVGRGISQREPQAGAALAGDSLRGKGPSKVRSLSSSDDKVGGAGLLFDVEEDDATRPSNRTVRSPFPRRPVPATGDPTPWESGWSTANRASPGSASLSRFRETSPLTRSASLSLLDGIPASLLPDPPSDSTRVRLVPSFDP